MTLRHMEVFRTVCKHNSFTNAAKELNVSQPAVSKTIQELEAYYNTKLFDRLNRKIILTEGGNTLLRYSEKILNTFEEAENIIKTPNMDTVLRIGSNVSYACGNFPKLLASFAKDNPQVRFKLFVANSSQIENKLLNNELDFAIVDNLSISPHFKSSLILKENMVMICGTEYLKAASQNVSLKDLRNEKFLFREKGSGIRDSVDDVFKGENITPNVIMESVSTTALVNAAASNLGITIVPETFALKHIAAGKLVRIKLQADNFMRKYFLIYNKNKYLSATMEVFLSYVNSDRTPMQQIEK